MEPEASLVSADNRPLLQNDLRSSAKNVDQPDISNISIDKPEQEDEKLGHSKTVEIQGIKQVSNPAGGRFKFGKGKTAQIYETQQSQEDGVAQAKRRHNLKIEDHAGEQSIMSHFSNSDDEQQVKAPAT